MGALAATKIQGSDKQSRLPFSVLYDRRTNPDLMINRNYAAYGYKRFPKDAYEAIGYSPRTTSQPKQTTGGNTRTEGQQTSTRKRRKPSTVFSQEGLGG